VDLAEEATIAEEITEIPSTKKTRILAGNSVASAIRSGILRAARDCEAWGGDWPTDRGCENLLQVRAAECVHDLLKTQGFGYITLEEPLATITEGGTRKRGRRFAGMTAQQRADLAIWTHSGRVYALVEVKRAESNHDWESDLVKLSKLLATYGQSHGAGLRYCVFGAFISSRSAAFVESRNDDLAKMASVIARSYGLRATTLLDEARHRGPASWGDEWTCGAASVLIKRP
jgi:hypothetical protein